MGIDILKAAVNALTKANRESIKYAKAAKYFWPHKVVLMPSIKLQVI